MRVTELPRLPVLVKDEVHRVLVVGVHHVRDAPRLLDGDGNELQELGLDEIRVGLGLDEDLHVDDYHGLEAKKISTELTTDDMCNTCAEYVHQGGVSMLCFLPSKFVRYAAMDTSGRRRSRGVSGGSKSERAT